MLKYAVCVFSLFIVVQADNQFPEGSWRILQFDTSGIDVNAIFEITKIKISRKEDGFNAKVVLPNVLDKTFALSVDVTKFTEAGWTNYTILKDGCALCFAEKYAPENFMAIKEAMGLDKNAQFIPAGTYNVENFPFNYCEMPSKGDVGKYLAEIKINTSQQIEACLMMLLEFREETDKCGEQEDDAEDEEK